MFSTRIPLETRTTAMSHLKRLQGKLELAISAGNVSEDDEEEVGGALVWIRNLCLFDKSKLKSTYSCKDKFSFV